MQSPETQEVHGHEVMHMMVESGAAYNADTLEAAIHERFGEATRFCTCSASGMTARELIAFLEQRGKFVPAGDGFSTEASKICNH